MTKSKAESKTNLENSALSKDKSNNLLRRFYYWTLRQAAQPFADVFIAVYAFLESIIIPLPSDPLLIARATAKPKQALWVSSYVTLASVLGGVGGYLIGLYFWETLSPFIYAYLFSEATFDLVVEQVQDSTFLFVFLGAFSPLPFKAFALSAGTMELPMLPFLLGCGFGRAIRFYVLGGLIYLFGDKIRDFIDKKLELIFAIAGVLVLVALIIKIGWF